MRPGRRSLGAARSIISPISLYSAMTDCHVPAVIAIGGSVKFSSGKTFPPPTFRPDPHSTGFGALPNVNPDVSGMRSVS